MKKYIIAVSLISLILPFASFGQTVPPVVTPVVTPGSPSMPPIVHDGSVIGGCMTIVPNGTNQLMCVYNQLLELTTKVKQLEARISMLEAKFGNNTSGVPTAGGYSGGSTNGSGGVTQVAPVDITTVQNFLKAEGSFTYPTATGYFGPITKEALKQFQGKQGIPTSGQIDSTTLEKMKALAPSIAPSMSTQIQKIEIQSAR